MARSFTITVATGLLFAGAVLADPPSEPDLFGNINETPGLLQPLPSRGAIPPIVEVPADQTVNYLHHRAEARQYRKQLGKIRHEHFGVMKVDAIRQAGIDQLRQITDPAAFAPMLTMLAEEKQDVRAAAIDHVASFGDLGQAALAQAYIAIKVMDKSEEDATRLELMRDELSSRLTVPASDNVLHVLDQALRTTNHETIESAGALAGQLNALETIPLLMFSQVISDSTAEQTGDLAWILIGTQTTYVQSLEPVLGDNSGAFQPVLAPITEGVVFRVMDAVVIIYRTQVHTSLVNMSSSAWGQPTGNFGYNPKKWWEWYNAEYVPFRNEQIRLAELTATLEEDSGE